ncbi:MAG: NDP-sugar synthase [Alphaproteobacteria bacterium]
MSADGHTIRHGGIIAAGTGSRLSAAGIALPKPLVPVAGRPLLRHVLDNFRAASIDMISIILNENSGACVDWLDGNAGDIDIDLIVKTTPSSIASFRIIADRLAGTRAVISTVDAWIPDCGFKRFVEATAEMPADALGLAVTDRVDDEKPLWVDLDPASGRVRALGEGTGSHVTAGLYALPLALTFPNATAFSRLRDYLRWVIESGRPVYGILVPNVVDVDRVADMAAAERLAALETNTP